MDTEAALTKLAFNLKIMPTTVDGIPIPLPFVAMFNPESFAIKEGVCWDTQAEPGSSGSDPQYISVQPRTFTIEFTLDGTGVNANGVKIPVTAQVLLFRTITTLVKGAIHRPTYLMVQYGTFICLCTLNNSTVTYTMFDKFGLPIRAKVSAEFTERTPSGLDKILGMFYSPDLTHIVEVKEYDLLPLLTYRTYNDQRYYLQVARINKLKNFRKLKPGRLYFPPFDDKSQ